MKLAIITPRYPEEKNPYNHMFVHIRAKYFQQKNVDVMIFVPSGKEEEYSYQGITVKKTSNQRIIRLMSGYDLIYLHLLNNYFGTKSGGYPIYKNIKKGNKPFAMFIHGSEILQYPDYLFDFNYSVRGIVKYLYVNYWNSGLMKKFISQTSTRKNVRFMFPSVWMKNHTEEKLNLKLSQYEIIQNGINTQLFSPSDNYSKRFKLLMIRPLSNLKYGFDIAIKIMSHLPEEYTLTIYGKGKYEKKCRELIKQLKISERVKIKNEFVEHPEMAKIFEEYGSFIATTRFDSQGVIMCEAMAAGLLTISNPITAIPEFIEDGETGILGKDPKEIASKFLAIINDSNEYQRIVQNARKKMENISVEKTGERELEVLKSLI